MYSWQICKDCPDEHIPSEFTKYDARCTAERLLSIHRRKNASRIVSVKPADGKIIRNRCNIVSEWMSRMCCVVYAYTIFLQPSEKKKIRVTTPYSLSNWTRRLLLEHRLTPRFRESDTINFAGNEDYRRKLHRAYCEIIRTTDDNDTRVIGGWVTGPFRRKWIFCSRSGRVNNIQVEAEHCLVKALAIAENCLTWLIICARWGWNKRSRWQSRWLKNSQETFTNRRWLKMLRSVTSSFAITIRVSGY